MAICSITYTVYVFLDGIDPKLHDLVCAEHPTVPEVEIFEVLAHPA